MGLLLICIAVAVGLAAVAKVLGVTNQTQALILLVSTWPMLAIMSAKAQYDRGGSIVFGMLVGLLLGPIGLLVANYIGGRLCPYCGHEGINRKAQQCLLASAATAQAECAWVFWIMVTPVGWQVGDTYRTEESCKSAIEVGLSGMAWSTPGQMEKGKRVGSRAWITPDNELGRALCLPDTVDPRGPKGK
jgi:hypothetical protein